MFVLNSISVLKLDDDDIDMNIDASIAYDLVYPSIFTSPVYYPADFFYMVYRYLDSRVSWSYQAKRNHFFFFKHYVQPMILNRASEASTSLSGLLLPMSAQRPAYLARLARIGPSDPSSSCPSPAAAAYSQKSTVQRHSPE